MGLGGSRWCSWLLVLTLVYGPGYGSARDGGLARDRRQQDWWREYQRFSPAQGSARASARDFARPVVGFGSRRGGSPSGWGASFGGLPRQAVQQVSQSSPISLQCGEDVMVVSVSRNFYGNGKLVKPSDLTLGPQSCQPTSQTADTVVFQNALQDCSNPVQMTSDFLIYSTSLLYNPTSNVPIIRTNSAVVPITCYYFRHDNVSSKAIRPTWSPFSTTISTEEKLSFNLQLMTDDWSGPRNSIVYQLGDTFNIEASVQTQNHIGLILFVDSCVATQSPDPTSKPSYDIISANGCLMDGMLEDSSSSFVSPRIQPDKLQFTVDAFLFVDAAQSEVYITCNLRAAPATQVPDSMNKACSFNKATNSWSPVEGSNSICQCCTAGLCSMPSGQARGWGSVQGRPRGFGKREAVPAGLQSEVVRQAVLGPLLIAGEESRLYRRNLSSRMSPPEAQPLELWVLVAVASVSLVVVIAGVAMTAKSIMNKFCNK
ncbi:zona pellucida sperm-binding protein 3-like [Hyperolius riggenbachi]|uniref:zona pellucida sperm-binding protein 3-like n=1 Tax=Hyperolius riggenbachi TaxID=752182 RepID=UPI0035A29DE1